MPFIRNYFIIESRDKEIIEDIMSDKEDSKVWKTIVRIGIIIVIIVGIIAIGCFIFKLGYYYAKK